MAQYPRVVKPEVEPLGQHVLTVRLIEATYLSETQFLCVFEVVEEFLARGVGGEVSAWVRYDDVLP